MWYNLAAPPPPERLIGVQIPASPFFIGRFKYKHKHKHNMAIKTITVTENAYSQIKKLKHGDESFSELFTRIAAEKSNNINKYFGILKEEGINMEKIRTLYGKIREDTSIALEKRHQKIQVNKRVD